jgi:hypothetical protein
MSPRTAKAPPKGASTTSYVPGKIVAAEDALRNCYLRDLRKDARWKQLSPGARHVAVHLAGHLGRSGEFFGAAEKRAKLVPALTGGRPSDSGHVSLPTLRRYERELERSGLFTVWYTNGTKLANGLRTNPIKVLRLARSVWALAWARFKYACGGTFSPVKTEASRGRRMGRLSKVGSRSREPYRHRTSSRAPDDADYCAHVKPELQLRHSRWIVNQLFERRVATAVDVSRLATAVEW